MSRFAAAPVLLACAATGFWLWRGRRAFTLRCARCGVSFCRRCHLGPVVADLCTQCYHLFVVRDGVSGPARNAKLMEVQVHEQHRDRVVRLLGLFLPGAGQVYAGEPARGTLLVALWVVPMACLAVSLGFVPFTEWPGIFVPPAVRFVLLVPFLLIWFVALRLRPTFDVNIPVRRTATPRRSSGPTEEH